MSQPTTRTAYPMDEGVRSRAMRLAIWQGVLETIGGWMIGGWFLNYFAMELGARGTMMGLVLAVGNVVGILRLFAPYFVNRSNNRKGVWLCAIVASRIISIGFPLLAFPQFRPAGIDPVWLLVGILCSTTIANAVSAIAWLSWYADIVPEAIWGRYFGRRNIYTAVAVAVVTIFGGWAVDAYTRAHPEAKFFAYALIYGVGIAFNIAAIFPMLLVPNLPLREAPPNRSLWQDIRAPFKDANFRRYALFHCWLMLGSGIPHASFQLYVKEYLGLGLLAVGTFQLTNQIFSVWGFRVFGGLTDRYGNKPFIILGLIGAALGPFFWIPSEAPPPALAVAVTAGGPPGWVRDLMASFHGIEYFGWIYAAYVVWGLGWAGVNLGKQNLMLKVAPQENNVAYIAAAEGLGGVCLAIFQVLGGMWLEGLLKADFSWQVGALKLNAYHLFFLASFVGRSSAALWVFGIREPGASTIRQVLTRQKPKESPELEPAPAGGPAAPG